MTNQRKIGRFMVMATEWQKHGKDRIYFDLDNGGKACFDKKESKFIKVKGRVGARFEHAIKEAFGL